MASTEAIISFSGVDKGLLSVLDVTSAGIDSFSDSQDSVSLAQQAVDSVVA